MLCLRFPMGRRYKFPAVIARSEATWQSVSFVPTAHQGERIAPQAFPSVTTPVCGLVRNDREWETFHVFAEAFPVSLLPTAPLPSRLCRATFPKGEGLGAYLYYGVCRQAINNRPYGGGTSRTPSPTGCMGPCSVYALINLNRAEGTPQYAKHISYCMAIFHAAKRHFTWPQAKFHCKKTASGKPDAVFLLKTVRYQSYPGSQETRAKCRCHNPGTLSYPHRRGSAYL